MAADVVYHKRLKILCNIVVTLDSVIKRNIEPQRLEVAIRALMRKNDRRREEQESAK